MEAGFTAFGHLNPFLDEGNDKVCFKTHIKKMRDAIENVHRIREVVGDRVGGVSENLCVRRFAELALD
jgi:galactonate dehydratase